MKKLYVFGDSYVAPHWHHVEWTKILANSLNLDYENFGVCGSSSEHAIRMFQKVSAKKITDSVIIILLSTPGRLDLEFQLTCPGTASEYLTQWVNISDPMHQWYKENKKYIEWFMVNYNHLGAYQNRECYIHALKNFAESDSSNTVIVLQNGLQSNGPDTYIHRGNIPSNFIIPEIDINKISNDEVINFTSFNDFRKYVTYDPRLNHLTIPNLNIMAESIKQIILTRDTSHLYYDKFKKNIINTIKTHEELNNYIESKILYSNIINHTDIRQ